LKNGSPVSGGISLDDKYLLEQGRAFMTGIQALVRLPLDRKRLDRKSGLNTAGFISGYRGSPLGGYDQQITAAKKLMDAHDVKLWEGLNEDPRRNGRLGQSADAHLPGAKFDGVFGIWYARRPASIARATFSSTPTWAGTDPKGGPCWRCAATIPTRNPRRSPRNPNSR
jgi:indolepyruvate ferredoxin oxidoreductase